MSQFAASKSPVPRSPDSVPRSPADEWLDDLRASVQRLGSALWEVGDLMQRAPDDMPGTEIAERSGASIGMLRTAKWVAKRFPAPERRSLGPSHHLEVAALPNDAAYRLLDRAAAENWTVIRLRGEARAARIGAVADARAAAVRQPDPASADWTTEARRAERELRGLAMEIAARLRHADGLVEALAAHPGRGAVHGNQFNAFIERFSAIFAALESELRAFLARSHLKGLEAT